MTTKSPKQANKKQADIKPGHDTDNATTEAKPSASAQETTNTQQKSNTKTAAAQHKQQTTSLQCSGTVIHEDRVRHVACHMAGDDAVDDLSQLFRIFGDPTRLRIIWALDLSELCVCDLSAVLGMSKSAVSHQLRVLLDAGLVRNRRESKVVYYSLDDEHVHSIFEIALTHLKEKNKL